MRLVHGLRIITVDIGSNAVVVYIRNARYYVDKFIDQDFTVVGWA